MICCQPQKYHLLTFNDPYHGYRHIIDQCVNKCCLTVHNDSAYRKAHPAGRI